MKTIKWLVALCVVVSAQAASYQQVGIDTNTGVYTPARAEADQHGRVQATTGDFSVLYVAGVRITGSSTTAVVQSDAPISGVETDGQVPASLVLRDVPTRYVGASFWYPFDYASAVIVDASGSGVHAVNRPAGSPMTWASYAEIGSKAGENYLVQVNSNGVLNLAPAATVGAWVWFDSVVTNNNVLLSAGGVSNRTAIWMDATNVYAVASGAGSTSTLTYAYGAGLVTGAWHRLVATYEKKGGSGTATGEHVLWLDGAAVASNQAAANFFIGNRTRFMALNTDGVPTGNAFVDGKLDDVFAVKSAWTGATVTNDWSAGRSMGVNEYAGRAPYPVVGVSPNHLANTATGIHQVLEWTASSVAQEYRLYSWTNTTVFPATAKASLTSNTYDIGATYQNSTNYWSIVASNVYGQVTSSVYIFYPFTFNTALYTGRALYANMTTDYGTFMADILVKHGTDNLTKMGGAAASSGMIALNADGLADDYLVSVLSATNYAVGTRYAFSVGFWYRFSILPTTKATLVMESSSPKTVAGSAYRTCLAWNSVNGFVWRVRGVNNLQSAEITYSKALDTSWHHIAVGTEMMTATNVRMALWYDGTLSSYAEVAVGSAAFGSYGEMVSPCFVGLDPAVESGVYLYGATPAIEIDDFFVTDSLLDATADTIPMFNMRRSP